MNIPKIKDLLGYEVIEQKDGFVTLPVEDFEKIEKSFDSDKNMIDVPTPIFEVGNEVLIPKGHFFPESEIITKREFNVRFNQFEYHTNWTIHVPEKDLLLKPNAVKAEVKEQAPVVEQAQEQAPAEKKSKAVEPTHADKYPYYS